MRVAVIGVGGSGSAACYHLARAGHEVVGFEQFSLDHDRGSSHGASRVIRLSYLDGFYTSLMANARPLWDLVEHEFGHELIQRCGHLMISPEDNDDVSNMATSLDAIGASYIPLTANEVAERYGSLRLAHGEHALLQPDGGFLRASRCVQAHATLARNRGATILTGRKVTAISETADAVVVHSDEVQHLFDRAIVTAGPWLSSLLHDLPLDLTVTRQELVYFAVEDERPYSPAHAPVWGHSVSNWYGFPVDGDVPGIKIAHHVLADQTDPDHVRAGLSDQTRTLAWEEARLRHPGVINTVILAKTCLYTNTTNEDFLLDRAPGHDRLWVVSGCSGHGFKFTTLLGKLAADLATDQPVQQDLSRFSFENFARP